MKANLGHLEAASGLAGLVKVVLALQPEFEKQGHKLVVDNDTAGALRKRKEIMNRRRVSDEYLAQWFAEEPRAVPLPQYALR